VAAAFAEFPYTDVLVLDAGTCLTYDFINAEGEYLGGAISPGLQMRAKAMNAFTADLPLVTPSDTDLIGRNTTSSLESGCIHGMAAEIDGIINRYRERYYSLQVILTGGDAPSLQGHLKNHIFARPNTQPAGLNELLLFNLAALEDQ
jgi:type III pantothenate kinase